MAIARKSLACLVAGLSLALAAQPALSSGGGGGGGTMAPSASAPDYDPVVEYRTGVTAFEAQDFKKAASSFEHVVAVAPKHAPAQYLLGASYLALKKYKNAKRPLESAVKIEPTMIDAQRDLGVTYAMLGDAAKAATQRQVLAERKAACAATCGDAARIDAALAAIDAASSGTAPSATGPDQKIGGMASVDRTYVEAVALINEGRYEPAITQLQAALWSAGPHPDLLTYLGFANRKLKRYDTARGWYEQALQVVPRHRGAIEYYGELKLEQGDRAGALQHLARLEAICGFGCVQADELRRWIAAPAQSHS